LIRKEILAQLPAHGVRPTATTSPELVREFVNDLYRYELRRLRDRLLRGEFTKASYYDRVVEVRMRYRVLAFSASQWIE
jgi:hypothetical protein